MNKKLLIIILIVWIIVIALVVRFLINRDATLSVTTNPTEAQVIIDDKTYSSPVNITLRPGTYVATASKDGYYANSEEFNVKRGEKKSINLILASKESYSADSFLQLLPYYDNTHLSIELVEGTNIKITLYATLNDLTEEKYNTYLEEIKQYKKEALDWIKSKNGDITKLKIDWIPEEAKDI